MCSSSINRIISSFASTSLFILKSLSSPDKLIYCGLTVNNFGSSCEGFCETYTISSKPLQLLVTIISIFSNEASVFEVIVK